MHAIEITGSKFIVVHSRKENIMIEIPKNKRVFLAPLFASTDETLVLSCLQGHMGRAFADDLQVPHCAQILIGDFCFFAGDALHPDAKKLVQNIPKRASHDPLLMIPLSPAWESLIEQIYEGRFEKTLRYAIKKEKDIFQRPVLERFASELPRGFSLHPIDSIRYHQCLEQDFSRDFCSQFSSAEDYQNRGLGICALHQGKIVSGASSYTIYDGGIEIEVDTHPDYRRLGLACACAAKLILLCLDRGLYPSWDAATLISVALAQKLGYHVDTPYPTYLI